MVIETGDKVRILKDGTVASVVCVDRYEVRVPGFLSRFCGPDEIELVEKGTVSDDSKKSETVRKVYEAYVAAENAVADSEIDLLQAECMHNERSASEYIKLAGFEPELRKCMAFEASKKEYSCAISAKNRIFLAEKARNNAWLALELFKREGL